MKSIENKRKRLEYALQIIWCCNLIVIINIIGKIGMLHFGYAYEIYMLFYTITIGSFPLAIYKLVKKRQQKEKYTDSRKVIKASGVLAAIYAIVGSVLLFSISEFLLTKYLHLTFAGIILKLFIPIYILQCIIQVLTSYFQAKGSLETTILARSIEGIVTFVATVFITSTLSKYGSKVAALLLDENYASTYGALGITASVAIGSVVSIFIFLIILFINKRNLKTPKHSAKSEESVFYLTQLLARTMFPYFSIIFLFRVPVLITFLLQNSISENYGLIYGIFLPFTILFVLFSGIMSLSKVGTIAASIKKQEYKGAKECFHTWIHLLLVIIGFVAILIITLADSLSRLLFKSAPAELLLLLQSGGISILFGAFALFFINLLMTIKKFSKVTISLGLSLTLFIVTVILSSKFGNAGILSFIYAWDVFLSVLAVSSGYFAHKAIKTSFRLNNTIIIPVVTLFVIGIALVQFEKLFLHMLGNGLCIVICFAFAFVVYVGVLTFTHNVNKAEIKELPLGKQILFIAQKLHLIS